MQGYGGFGEGFVIKPLLHNAMGLGIVASKEISHPCDYSPNWLSSWR